MHRRTLVSTIAISALFVALHESAAVGISVSGGKYSAAAMEGKVVVTDASGKTASLPAGAAEVVAAPSGKGVLVKAIGAKALLRADVRSRRSLRSKGSTMTVFAELAKGQSLAVDEGAKHVGLETSSDAVGGSIIWRAKGGRRPMRLGIRLSPNTQLVIRIGSLIMSQSAGQTTVTIAGLKFIVEDSATLELGADPSGQLRVRKQGGSAGRIWLVKGAGEGGRTEVTAAWLVIGGDFPYFDKPYYVTGGTSPAR